MAAAKKIAMEISRDKKMPYINGYDHPLIMSGQGTIGLEIVEQCEGADAIGEHSSSSSTRVTCHSPRLQSFPSVVAV
jgi:hypothetical protein